MIGFLQLAVGDPRAALKLLRRKSKPYKEAIGLGRPIHEEFCKKALDIISRDDPSKAVAKLPSVSFISWRQVSVMQELADAARFADADIIYMVPEKPGDDADAMAQIDSSSGTLGA